MSIRTSLLRQLTGFAPAAGHSTKSRAEFLSTRAALRDKAAPRFAKEVARKAARRKASKPTLKWRTYDERRAERQARRGVAAS